MKKSVKVTIITILVMVLAGAGIAQATYFSGYRTGYIYTSTGEEFDNGFTKGKTWRWNGEKELWTIDELKDLAKTCRVTLTGMFYELDGLGFTLSDNKVLVVPGLSLDDGIAETYYLTF